MVTAIAVRNGQTDGSGNSRRWSGSASSTCVTRTSRASCTQANHDRLIGRILPERLASGDGGQAWKIAVRRRRTRRPLEGAGIPRIVGGDGACHERAYGIDDESRTAQAMTAAPTLAIMFRLPQSIAAGYVYTRRGMPWRPRTCIGKNVTLKPTKNSPKTHAPTRSERHRPTISGPVEGGKEWEHRAADQDVVKVRDDEEGIVHLGVERHGRQHHAGQPADDEDGEEPENPDRDLHGYAARPERRNPAEDLRTAGTAMMMLAAVKKLAPSCGRPVANMWWTHSPKPIKAVDTSDRTTAR